MQELRRQNTEESHVVAGRDPSKRTTALAHQTAYRACVEIARVGDCIRREQGLDVAGGPRLQEAFTIGRAIRLLRSLDDRLRQVPAERLAQHVLLAQSLDLE